MKNIFKKEIEGLPIWGWLIASVFIFVGIYGINTFTSWQPEQLSVKEKTQQADCSPKNGGGFLCEITTK